MKSRTILLFAILFFSFQSLAARAPDSGLTPLPGDPLRKQVLDALRQDVKRMHSLDVVFVVDHLRVKDGWAWVETQPQSPDGMSHYESLSALLHFQDEGWVVMDTPCTEPENPECPEESRFFEELQKRYPTVPTEIFPE